MVLDLDREMIRVPGARRLFRAAQHHIDHLMSTTTARVSPELALDWCGDVLLQLGWDLDRLARKAELARTVRLSVPAGRVAA